ncbi:hypothetical protein B0H14DRAFT_2630337 [Mycena olivaceomarginata]|nr:hypothetical protein B0H14DRAFT_2630337 [Mycena olivaceomarginata]
MARIKPQVDKAHGSGSSSLDDKAQHESNAGFKKIVFIPDAYFANPEASDAADDIKDMGVAPVPSINRHQQLKDVSLVIRSTEGLLTKKGALNGQDLATVKMSKGKRVDQSTLYFALHYNVPNKIWTNDHWANPPSDSDLTEKSMKGKAKGKAQLKPLSTRQSTRKVAVKEDNSIIEVESDRESSSGKGKTSRRTTPVKVKIESGSTMAQGASRSSRKSAEDEMSRSSKVKMEPAASTADLLFLEIDSDSDTDFPASLIGPTSTPITTDSPVAPPLSSSAGGASTAFVMPAPVAHLTAIVTPSGLAVSTNPAPSILPPNGAMEWCNVVPSGIPSILQLSSSRAARYFKGCQLLNNIRCQSIFGLGLYLGLLFIGSPVSVPADRCGLCTKQM